MADELATPYSGRVRGPARMRAFHHRILACVALSCWAVAAAAAPESDTVRPKAPVTSLPRHWQPMLFFVAKGAAGACGPGCSEWIAAEGNVDADAPERLRDFLVPLNGTLRLFTTLYLTPPCYT